MANGKWQIRGNYMETCSCDFVCPCTPSNLAAQPTKGSCTAALFYHIDQGHFNGIQLDDLSFAVILYTPGKMGEGNWSVGVITDARASAEQQEAILAIASGQGGGPMAALAPLVGNFLGVESGSFNYQVNELTHTVSVGSLLDQECKGVPSVVKPDEALYIDNTLHPTNSRLGLANATRSHLHAFGIDWDDTSGMNNGHFAPFNWQGS